MRQFFLKNSLGQEWDLNQLDGGFYSPSGLGFTKKMVFQQIGKTQYTLVSENLEQKKIQGDFVFKNYETYNNFIKFVQHTPLILEYKAADMYSIRCDITSLKKSEKNDGFLYCNSILTTYGTFYKSVYVENSDTNTGKKYDYTYDYTYVDNQLGQLEIESDSVLDSPAKIVIFGPVINPSWTHTINGNQVINGKINCSVPRGHKLVVDATSMPAFTIKEYDQGGEEYADRYMDSDFSTRRFVILGNGVNRITLTHEGDGAIRAVLEGEINYESV
ncbi:MAG: hypothetical protein MJZ37_08085 [Bacilli bacterium]|nr:hypothetical protein [Bacilli bacterium]